MLQRCNMNILQLSFANVATFYKGVESAANQTFIKNKNSLLSVFELNRLHYDNYAFHHKIKIIFPALTSIFRI